jgi:hypothetical protein
MTELERNDIAGALEFRRQCRRNGTWNSSRAHMLLMMQDDPRELQAAMRAEDATEAKR